MLKNRTISSILRYCKTKPRFLDTVTETALFQNHTNQGRVIPRPYCIYIHEEESCKNTSLFKIGIDIISTLQLLST